MTPSALVASEFWSTSGLGKDIVINLVAIPVNIAITVFLVERLVNRRDAAAGKARSGVIEWELGDIADELLTAFTRSAGRADPRELHLGGRELQLLSGMPDTRGTKVREGNISLDAGVRVCRTLQASSARVRTAEVMIGAAASGDIVESGLRFVSTCELTLQLLGDWDAASHSAPPGQDIELLALPLLTAAHDVLSKIEKRWAPRS